MTRSRLDTTFGLTRQRIAALRSDAALLQLRLAIKDFDEALHPRWPGGTQGSRGGEFRPRDSSGAAERSHVASFDEANREKCDAMRMKDEELCATQLSKWCWDSAFERHLNCMRGVYIPPLKVGIQWGR
jgi:hypothetical protein